MARSTATLIELVARQSVGASVGGSHTRRVADAGATVALHFCALICLFFSAVSEWLEITCILEQWKLDERAFKNLDIYRVNP
jgi:hypothetical protein